MRPKIIYNYQCEQCKIKFTRNGRNKKRNVKNFFCTVECSINWKKINYKGKKFNDALPHYYGKKHPRYKGGYLNKNGYVEICVNGEHKLEHRHIMEKFLKRKLDRHENVHHINGIKNDNNIKNLEIISTSRHSKIHCFDRSRANNGQLLS